MRENFLQADLIFSSSSCKPGLLKVRHRGWGQGAGTQNGKRHWAHFPWEWPPPHPTISFYAHHHHNILPPRYHPQGWRSLLGPGSNHSREGKPSSLRLFSPLSVLWGYSVIMSTLQRHSQAPSISLCYCLSRSLLHSPPIQPIPNSMSLQKGEKQFLNGKSKSIVMGTLYGKEPLPLPKQQGTLSSSSSLYKEKAKRLPWRGGVFYSSLPLLVSPSLPSPCQQPSVTGLSKEKFQATADRATHLSNKQKYFLTNLWYPVSWCCCCS